MSEPFDMERAVEEAEYRREAREDDKLSYVGRWAHCPSTHCERRQECASPSDCAASLNSLREAAK